MNTSFTKITINHCHVNRQRSEQLVPQNTNSLFRRSTQKHFKKFIVMEEKIARFFIFFAKMFQASYICKPYHLALTKLALPNCVPPPPRGKNSPIQSGHKFANNIQSATKDITWILPV
jgi:hypothetical protein